MNIDLRVKCLVGLVADYLATYHKLRGSLGQAGGPCCVIGAALVMESDPTIRGKIFKLIRKNVPEAQKWGIPYWSDRTSEREVIEVLRKISN